MKKLFKNGISIRLIHVLMLICAVAIVLLLVFSTQRTSAVFTTLSNETENYIVRQKAAHDLMEASDYLTENVQRFTLDGDPKYMNQYFEEANNSKRREAALTTMTENHADEKLIKQLQEALDESRELMWTEYDAMTLVVKAQGEDKYPNTPDVIRAKLEVESKNPDENSEQQMKHAHEMVTDKKYYDTKEIIRTKLRNSLDMMDNQMAATRRKTTAYMIRELNTNRTIVIILVIVLAALMIMTAVLSTIPLINAHKAMHKNERLLLTGSKEFREMSESYNELYDKVHPDQKE